MATVTKGRTFVSGETVTPTKLNELVDLATVTAIQTADISDAQVTTAKIADSAVTNAKIASGVDASKLTTGTLPADRIGSSAITTARINDGAVTAAKLDGAQTGSAPIYGCRAWVNFDGERNAADDGPSVNGGTVKIRAAGNVSSVTRVATGNYTVTFTTAMPSANYAAVATAGEADSSTGAESTATTNRTTTGFAVYTGNSATGALLSRPDVSVAVFG